METVVSNETVTVLSPGSAYAEERISFYVMIKFPSF